MVVAAQVPSILQKAISFQKSSRLKKSQKSPFSQI
jgi:hypothetical protein